MRTSFYVRIDTGTRMEVRRSLAYHAFKSNVFLHTYTCSIDECMYVYAQCMCAEEEMLLA